MFAPAPSIVRSANHNPTIEYCIFKNNNILQSASLSIQTIPVPLYIQSIFEVKKKNLPTVSSFALICRARCNTREYVQVTGVRYRILNVTYCKQPFRPRVEREKKKDRMSLSRIFRHAYTTRDARVTRHV